MSKLMTIFIMTMCLSLSMSLTSVYAQEGAVADVVEKVDSAVEAVAEKVESAADAMKADGSSIIGEGKQVTFDYTLKINNVLVESSDKKGPIEYTHGEGRIIPGLASELEGLKVGDAKSVTVNASEAYGEVNEEAYREVPKTMFPEDFDAKEGMVIELKSPEGESVPTIIWEVKDETVVLNFNHPLAGKTLQFDVKIVSIK